MQADLDRLVTGDAPTARASRRCPCPRSQAETTQLHQPDHPADDARADGRRGAPGGTSLLALGVIAVLGLVFFLATQVFGGGGTKVRVPDLTGQTEAIADRDPGSEGPHARHGHARGEHGRPRAPSSPRTRGVNAEVEPGTRRRRHRLRRPGQVDDPDARGPHPLRGHERAHGRRPHPRQRSTPRPPTCPPTPCSSSDPQEGTKVDAGQRGRPRGVVRQGQGARRHRQERGAGEGRPRATPASRSVEIQQEDGSVDVGTVLAQSPAGGTQLAVGKTVTITVAKAPPPPPTRGQPTPASPSDA